MKHMVKVFFSIPVLAFPVLLSAQTYSTFSDVTVQFKSDTTTKSVLLSNVKEEAVGDLSPFIGVASWYDLNKPLVCRSLLSFDMGIFPKLVRPDQILDAQLILKPYDPVANTAETKLPDNMQFFVKRVTESWIDSLTSWQTQPAASSSTEPNKVVLKIKKNPEVRIDVTETVKNMFRQGNNGFMITLKEADEAASTRTHYWFASARNEDEKLRPVLLLKFSYPSFTVYNNNWQLSNDPLFNNTRDWNSYMRTVTIPTAPVTSPVAQSPRVVLEPPVKDNNPPLPKSGSNN